MSLAMDRCVDDGEARKLLAWALRIARRGGGGVTVAEAYRAAEAATSARRDMVESRAILLAVDGRPRRIVARTPWLGAMYLMRGLGPGGRMAPAPGVLP